MTTNSAAPSQQPQTPSERKPLLATSPALLKGNPLNNLKNPLEKLPDSEIERLKKQVAELKAKAIRQMGQEDYEYRTERQQKIWLAIETPTNDNPLPEFNEANMDRVVPKIKMLNKQAPLKPKHTELNPEAMPGVKIKLCEE